MTEIKSILAPTGLSESDLPALRFVVPRVVTASRNEEPAEEPELVRAGN